MTANSSAAHPPASPLTPLQCHIQKMSLCRALLEAKRWMDDRDTRLSVLLVSLSEVLDQEGCPLNLNDPVVAGFIKNLALDNGQNLNALSIHGALSKRFISSYVYSVDGDLFPFMDLVTLREGNSWAELDRLFECCFERPLSSFYNGIKIGHHPEDTGFFHGPCYEIRLFTTTKVSDAGMISQFAVATNLDFIFRLVGMIVSGEIKVKDPYQPKKTAIITDIQVTCGKTSVFDGVLYYRVEEKNQVMQTKPLGMSGKHSNLFGNRAILPYLKPLFSSYEYGLLKGGLLQDCMGL